MFRFLRRAWLADRLWRSRIAYPVWRTVIDTVPTLRYLGRPERVRLRQLAGRFLARKSITGVGNLHIEPLMRVRIAAQACLPILGLDLGYYRGWSEVLVYPDSFVVPSEEADADGVVHRERRVLSGESWHRGPVILSWADILAGSEPHAGVFNVIVHEFAHKLDMLNGDANGMPPLHPDMDRRRWTDVLSHAYDDLCARVDAWEDTGIDPYATENPAEFFAVLTELFFEDPGVLLVRYPAVYQQFRLFYRQDPERRISGR